MVGIKRGSITHFETRGGSLGSIRSTTLAWERSMVIARYPICSLEFLGWAASDSREGPGKGKGKGKLSFDPGELCDKGCD